MLPAFDACVLGKMFPGVFVGQNAGTSFVQPLIATSVIEVPVRVY